MNRDFYLLTYDIASDARRAKIAKFMEALGDRVQGSVFEAYLTPAELEQLVKKALKVLNKAEDSLRIYPLCAACRGKLRTHGCAKTAAPPGVKII